jgi:hypothetical protein
MLEAARRRPGDDGEPLPEAEQRHAQTLVEESSATVTRPTARLAEAEGARAHDGASSGGESVVERQGIDDGGPQRQAYVLLITLARAAGAYAQLDEVASAQDDEAGNMDCSTAPLCWAFSTEACSPASPSMDPESS